MSLLVGLGLLVAVAVVGAPRPAVGLSDSHTVKYEITLTGLFDADALAANADVPTDAGFGLLYGSSHRSDAAFWSGGVGASAGVESLAETSSIVAIYGELEQAIADGEALKRFRSNWGSLAPTAEGAAVFLATEEFSRLTFMSRVAPSPDWFIGLSGLPDSDWCTARLLPGGAMAVASCGRALGRPA